MKAIDKKAVVKLEPYLKHKNMEKLGTGDYRVKSDWYHQEDVIHAFKEKYLGKVIIKTDDNLPPKEFEKAKGQKLTELLDDLNQLNVLSTVNNHLKNSKYQNSLIEAEKFIESKIIENSNEFGRKNINGNYKTIEDSASVSETYVADALGLEINQPFFNKETLPELKKVLDENPDYLNH